MGQKTRRESAEHAKEVVIVAEKGMSPSPSSPQPVPASQPTSRETAALHDLFKEHYQVKVAVAAVVLSEQRTGQEPLFYWREMDQITRLLIRGQSCFETRLLLRFLSLRGCGVFFQSSAAAASWSLRVYLKARVPPSSLLRTA